MRSAQPVLRGLGTALPSMALGQAEIGAMLAELWRLEGAALARWHRIVRGSGIDRRCGVATPADVMGLTTAARMRLYERHAPEIAECAARAALDDAGLSPRDVTGLVIVSCTGASAPGLDVDLIERLGLPAEVHRTMIGFMGCFGALSGLRVAAALAQARPDEVIVLVCVELCSLHIQPEADEENRVAAALFGDGAAAAVVTRADCACGGDAIGDLHPGRTCVIPEGRDWMSWRIGDHGFAMTLSRKVPRAVRRALARIGAAPGAGTDLVIHPGGPDILDAARDALGCGDERLVHAREVLRSCGNMSSPTVLFVLDRARRAGSTDALLVAFGPGLTIDSARVARAPVPARPVPPVASTGRA